MYIDSYEFSVHIHYIQFYSLSSVDGGEMISAADDPSILQSVFIGKAS